MHTDKQTDRPNYNNLTPPPPFGVRIMKESFEQKTKAKQNVCAFKETVWVEEVESKVLVQHYRKYICQPRPPWSLKCGVLC